MSKSTKTLEKKTEGDHPKSRGEIGPTMQGSDILVACLEREGVDTIFAYPGGASMEFHQSLTRSKKI
ncbi:MAG TPA: acetolactate synthase, partial [Candidatus Binatia bacterium]|nr:acetolactate synthase [Candidatus Binatia bacterium]